jgi:branched-chain amino acid aminotransferase
MPECIGKIFVLNGEQQPTELFDKSLVYEGDSVYEVIRMLKGRPVFFYDHIERLKTSVKLQKKNMLAGIDELRRDVLTLAKSEKRKEVNLKIVFNYSKSDNRLVYLIEPVYPTIEQYKKGVKGILFFAERKHPESKVIDHRLRSQIYHKLVLDSAYEAILVNKTNCITEGSRSNIFFMKNEKLFTAPDEKVLSGITRKHVIDICREQCIDVTFTCIHADCISEYDSVFMTGTSPLVLPFSCIGNSYFNPNHKMVTLLRDLYLERAEESIRQFNDEPLTP